MNSIFVNSDRISRAGADVVAISVQLDHEIAGLHESLEQIRNGWSSDRAAPRFAAVLLDYLDQATALKRALTDQGEALSNSGKLFADAEDVIATGFGTGSGAVSGGGRG